MTGKMTKGLSWLKTAVFLSGAFFGFKALFGMAQPDPGKVVAEALMAFFGAFLIIGIPAFVLGWLTGNDNGISTPPIDEVLRVPFLDTKPEPQRENSESATSPKVFTFRNELENAEPKHPSTKPTIGNSARPPPAPPVEPVPDEAFAEAMAEIEESRTVKGLWARCYAETGGDEQRTKVAYLSKRAEVLAAEFNRRLFLEAQANRRSKELSTLMAGADSNDPSAIFKLGMLFRTQNELVQADEERALACITKAAFLWHAEAQNQLSMMYWNGDGVPQSKCDALAWCRCAGVNDATYWKRVTQWMTLIDSPEVTESDEIVASIVAVKDNPKNVEGAIAALKTRNLALANTSHPT